MNFEKLIEQFYFELFYEKLYFEKYVDMSPLIESIESIKKYNSTKIFDKDNTDFSEVIKKAEEKFPIKIKKSDHEYRENRYKLDRLFNEITDEQIKILSKLKSKNRLQIIIGESPVKEIDPLKTFGLDAGEYEGLKDLVQRFNPYVIRIASIILQDNKDFTYLKEKDYDVYTEYSIKVFKNRFDYIKKNIQKEKVIQKREEKMFILSISILSRFYNKEKIEEKILEDMTPLKNDLLNDVISSRYGLPYEQLEPLDPLSECTWDSDKKIIHTHNIKIAKVNEISDIYKELKGIPEEVKNNLFFRGHSNLNYLLEPSIVRTFNCFKNENKMYEEMLVQNPDEFNLPRQTHLDILKKMQHYGLPTRLLDITENLLIGLYFAVESQSKSEGELIVLSQENKDLKFTRSDSVSIICSLPPFEHQDKLHVMELSKKGWKNHNKKEKELEEKLIHEIASEKPYFKTNIKADSLKKDYFVIPQRDNRRIIQQSAAFIVCCLNANSHGKLNDHRLKVSNKQTIFVIPHNKKYDILEELKIYGITQKFIYPEIEKVSEYLRKEYEK